jgi:hypothetical protein
MIKRFEDIRAWEKARGLVCEVYRNCAVGPIAKDYGLKDSSAVPLSGQ